MKILFISEDHSSSNFGVTTMLSQLADELVSRYDDTEVVIAATGKTAVPQHERVRIELIPPVTWAYAWRWSPDLAKRIENLVRQHHVDLIHIHGVWSAGPWIGFRLARQMKIPVVVSVHGMWEKWFWEKDNPLRILKKKLYFNWILQHAISPDVTIHTLNPAEEHDISHLLPHNKIVVIPNAVYIKDHQPISIMPEKVILFLGRLHPKKGVELLIRAFARARLEPSWQLAIAGPWEVPNYIRMLQAEVAKNGLHDQVKFLGPVFGGTKQELICKAWVQVLPTFSEGQAMINLETATYNVPSITTFQAGLYDWQEGGGLLIQPDVEELADKLGQVSRWSLEERNRRGARLRQWVRRNYSFDATMPKWEKLYSTVTARDMH